MSSAPEPSPGALAEALAELGLAVEVEAVGRLALVRPLPHASIDWAAERREIVRLATRHGFSNAALELPQVRLFVALNLLPEVRAAAWAAAEPVRAALPSGVSWVREEALHVTLRFLGEQPDEVPDALASALAPALARAERPGVRLDTVGAFPTMRRPRVLWLGGPSNSALAQLYQEVQRACASLGFEPEPRPFRLHVTIGRVRQGARLDPDELARGAEQVRVDAEFVASSVDVMESVLGPGGSRYRVVAAVPIGPRGG